MPISCDPNDLATAATCFSELSWRQRQQIRVYLLCTLVNGDTPVDCTPDALAAAAACYNKLSSGQLDQIETYLFCQLASGGGGGGNTIYTANDTVVSDRTLTGASHVLIFNSFSNFEIQTDPTFTANNYTAVYVNSGGYDLQSSDLIGQARIRSIGSDLAITADGSCSVKGTAMYIGYNNSTIGFYGSSGVTLPASADQAVATDPASTMALANALRAALIPTTGVGLIKGSA